MAALEVAYLGGEALPLYFSYIPWIPEKRISRRRTQGGVVTQRGNPEYFIGDGTIEFNFQGSGADFAQLNTLYLTSGDLTFAGYWGESYTVTFDRLDNPKVTGRIWTISGILTVKCVLDDLTPVC